MSYEIDKKGNISEVQQKKKVSLRDFLKDISQKLINNKTDLRHLKQVYDAESRSLKNNIVGIEKQFELVEKRLDAKTLKELQIDRNAYQIMHLAFPVTFPKKKVTK
ncbi:MAG: hypothetical protein V3V19_11290 [Cocleimonas sp.]